MEIKTKNCYKIPFEEIKEKFPEIKGELEEMFVDDKNSILVIDTISSKLDERKIKVWKEPGETPDKDVFIAKDIKTGKSSPGKTEEEAKKELEEFLKA